MDTPRAGAPAPALLLAPADGGDQAARALAEGADLIDVSGCGAGVIDAIRARCPHAALWPDQDGPGRAGPVLDADLLAAGVTGGPTDAPAAAVVAVAAISAWLGTPIIRTRHVRVVRRAIDMTAAIAGTRPPALTTRGLA